MGLKARRGPSLAVRLSSFNHPNGDLCSFVHGHAFNHAVNVLLPLPDRAEPEADAATAAALAAFAAAAEAVSAVQFCAARVDLWALADADFIKAHVAVDEGPRIIAVSANTPLDRTDGAALTPDGRLHLALTRGAHERLGLVGARSRTGADGYRVVVDLAGRAFHSASPFYHRVQDALRERAQPLDLLCMAARGRPRGAGGPDPDPLPALPDLAGLPGVHAWAPQRLQHSCCQRPPAALPDLAACLLRAGAAALFPGAEQAAEPAGAAESVGEARGQGGAPGVASGEAAERVQRGSPTVRRSVPDQPAGAHAVPGLRRAGADAAHEQGVPAGVLAAVHEWLGAQACAFAEPDADAASASADLPAAPEMALTQHLWRGLLPSECVERLIDAGRGLLAAGACPWAAVSVWGFGDAPVSWRGAEHGRATCDGGGGENDYSVVLLPGGQYVLFVASGAADGFTKF